MLKPEQGGSPAGEGAEPPGKEPHCSCPSGSTHQHHEIGLLVGSSEKNWAKMGHFGWKSIGDSMGVLPLCPRPKL